MRLPMIRLMPLFVTTLAACGTPDAASSLASPPCTPPTGCVRSGEVAGSCQCLEWELVSIEPVPTKYVVVGIMYAVAGNATVADYGNYPASGTDPGSSSEFGTRFRSVVIEPDGTGTVAALGPVHTGLGVYDFGVAPVTTTAAAIVMGANCVPPGCRMGIGISGFGHDLPSHENDLIFLWMNPGAAVTTDYAGRRTVAWSSPGDPWVPLIGVTYLAGWLDGSIPVPAGVARGPMPDPADVPSILRHDPFFASTAPDSSTLAADPRYRFLGTAGVGGTTSSTLPTSWACSSPLTDDAFPVLDSASVPFGTGETLLLQATTVGRDSSCAVQTPGLSLGTSTPGCTFQADIFVDTVFGTLLTVPTSADPACTVAP